MPTANKNRAFTLIELLLVIVIIGILVSTGLSLLQIRAKQSKVEKTALQIQQILQAGMAFYVDNGCWPIKNGKPTDCKTSSPPDFETTYVPVGSTKNPWGNDYTWTKKDTLFQLTTILPDGQTANNIAALLPSASVTDSTLVTEVTVPAQAVNNSIILYQVGTLIFHWPSVIGSTVASAKISIPVCPKYAPNPFMSASLVGYTLQNTGFGNDWTPVVPYKQDITAYWNTGIVEMTSVSTYCQAKEAGAAGLYSTFKCERQFSLLSSAIVSYTIYCCKNKDCST